MWLFKNCPTCGAYQTQIAYLKEFIERLVKERESERAEYKRAMDVIMVQKGLPAVGQGYTQPDKTFDPQKMFGFFDEDTKEKT